MKTYWFVFLVLASGMSLNADTVLYSGNTVEIEAVLTDPTDLWVKPRDLTRINGFELKPEGACIEDICVPVKQDEDSSIFVRRKDQAWFNVTELADRLQQVYVADHEQAVWSFGPVPVLRSAFVKQAQAPDFTLMDRQGKPVSLQQFDGMKVILLTWASW